jgi:arginase family enzyme
MRRRFPRRPRRPMAPGARAGQIPHRARRMLIRANRLMAGGDHAVAAPVYAGLARRARDLAMPVRAAHLDLQSSRALLASGQAAAALNRATASLLTLIDAGRSRQAALLLSRVAGAFRDRGHETEAAQVEASVEEALRASGITVARSQEPEGEESARRRGSLPARCPGCAAPLQPDEVEWHGPASAECVYCGSAVKTF